MATGSPPPASAATGGGLGGDLRKPRNQGLAILFLVLFLALLGARFYAADRALHIPKPNFIAASEMGIASVWSDRVLITDLEGTLVRTVALPDDVVPTQLLWAGEELWVADYRTKRILVIGEDRQRWLELKGPKLSAHFKVVPDPAAERIFVSAGHSMLVYDLEGNYRSSFGRKGRQPGELMFPNQFLLEESGSLLISNTKSPGIDRYSPEGRFIGRVVRPTGDAEYRYPTNVALASDRIITLEADGYLQAGRIALYSSQGEYLGAHEPVGDFTLIGDIAAWGGRVYATDIENAKVYAFAADDLHYLGEYSDDLRRVGEESRNDFRLWDRLSKASLGGLLSILTTVICFYVRFRKGQGSMVPAPPGRYAGAAEPVPANAKAKDAGARRYDGKAALLSALFPGLGQFYKREIVKGGLIMTLFTAIAFVVALNFEPAIAGSIDWTPVSILGMGKVLLWGLFIYAASIWDACRN